MEILKIENLNKNFSKLNVLKNINFSLQEGEILSILGNSGCGKSTLLRIIAGLETKDSGNIIKKCKVAMMFQNYALFPHLNVYKNIEFALSLIPKNQRENIIDDLLCKFKIQDIKNKMCDQISGGQAQRVAFARAIANKEKLLLLDEPFSNLDDNLRNSLRFELKELIKQNGISAIIVTHDKQDAFLLSDKIALMKNAEILDIGEPKKLYFNPKNYELALFLGNINLINKNDVCKLDDNFKKWLFDKDYMFRPEEIKIGTSYKAKVLQNEFLGAFCMLYLDYQGIKFKAMLSSDNEIKEYFWFDLN